MEADIKISGNNKFLKQVFPKSKITHTKIALAPVNVDRLLLMVRDQLKQTTYTKLQLVDVELEGMFNDWTLCVKINLS